MNKSIDLFNRACRVMPGGSTRSTIVAAPSPVYMSAGEGAWLTDVEGRRHLDSIFNYTSLIHGHGHQPTVEAIRQQSERLTTVSFPTELDITLAETICARSPSFEQIRFTNTGTEAVMLAIKAARAFTGRPKVLKFEGSYHGSYDTAEVSLDPDPKDWDAGPPRSVAYARGTPQGMLADVIVAPYNDSEAVARIAAPYESQIAAILVDLAPSRIGLLQATPEFVASLRRLADRTGAVLIFDEVISLRLAFGGAQSLLGIHPDLTTLGKFIGGGLPIGAVAGATEVMSVFEQASGKAALPHGGTFNANPLTMAAGLATLNAFDRPAIEAINSRAAILVREIEGVLHHKGLPSQVTLAGSLFRIHLTDRPLINYRSVRPDPTQANVQARLQRDLAARGVALGLNLFGCISTATGPREIEFLLDALDCAVRGL